MRVLLELLRIIIIFGILSALGWAAIEYIYRIYEATETYSWLGAVAIFLLLFVLYRNKLQFSGWYKGKAKLPKTITVILLVSSVVLLILPLVLGSL
ncbi:hypothetical protein [Oceanobacillus halophilus]|uniref:DUF4181 domain-containing protein n=1 Tax=Oceanobacillus halophilus TaxID=930130 RepID=A0A495A7G3_9BACI|nr:hypothetical protein [Oceanobacillus halophilus]RKQ35698.1 hypothetical protein D8M06_05380 [Oceanobacillus halophilus]